MGKIWIKRICCKINMICAVIHMHLNFHHQCPHPSMFLSQYLCVRVFLFNMILSFIWNLLFTLGVVVEVIGLKSAHEQGKCPLIHLFSPLMSLPHWSFEESFPSLTDWSFPHPTFHSWLLNNFFIPLCLSNY